MKNTKLPTTYNRSHFDLLGQRRVFVSVLDLSIPLKDQEIEFLIIAFRAAFPIEDQSVELVIYLENPELGKGLYKELSSYIEGDNRICYWDTHLCHNEIISLIACSDVFVDLRGDSNAKLCTIAEQFQTPVLNIVDFTFAGSNSDLNEFSEKLKIVKKKKPC